jgi:hypothetical protein
LEESLSLPIGGIERKQNHNWNNGIMMKSKKVEHQRKCYPELGSASNKIHEL